MHAWEVEVRLLVLKRCAAELENKTNTYTNIKDSTLSVKEKSKLLEGKDCIFFLNIYSWGLGESIYILKSRAPKAVPDNQ